MKNLSKWLNTERRQKIQLFFGSLAPLFILFGMGSQESWEQTLVIIGAAMQFLASLLSLVNIRISDWSTQGWAIVRGAIYTLGFTVAPALVLLGVFDEQTSTTVLLAISLGLSSLSALVAIFTAGQQKQAVLTADLQSIQQGQIADSQNRQSGATGDGLFQ